MSGEQGPGSEHRCGDHDAFDQLAVGYALDALEPDDEQVFMAHLPGCSLCRRTVDETREVLGEMARDVPTATPPPELWEAIAAQLPSSAFSHPGLTAGAPDNVRQLPPRRGGAVGRLAASSKGRSWLAAAAGLLVVIALVGWNATLQRDQGQTVTASSDRAQVLRLMEDPATSRVALSEPDGDVRGLAVVSDGHVWLVVDGLARNDASSTTYVLWGAPEDGDAVPITTFDVDSKGVDVIDAGPLGTSMSDLSAFAVSLEAGRQAPAHGSTPIVTGPVNQA